MRTRNFNVFVAIVLFFTPTLGFGHPGHGTFDGINFWHYLTSPLHIMLAAAIIAVVVFGVRYLRKRSSQTN
ncbi:MAG: hypothetical protein L3J06_03555 [Cyclobacteriaceae bacterium]|nr:hypothetical protein [Cyclobacteriaceae bacterium]